MGIWAVTRAAGRDRSLCHGALAQVWPRPNPGYAHRAHVPLHALAIDRPNLRLQEHRQLARARKGMRGVQLVNAMLDRHFLRRWRHRLIGQTLAAAAEQIGLGTERERIGSLFDQRAPLPLTQDGNFFFRKVTWVVKRPISATDPPAGARRRP